MPTQDCTQCGRPAEPPHVVMRYCLPEELAGLAEDEGIPIEQEKILCGDCYENVVAEQEGAEEID